MPDRKKWPSQAGREASRRPLAAGEEATTAREQATRPQGEPGSGTLTEVGGRPQITLENGAVVDAQEAAHAWRDMQALLAGDPEEFRALLALAQGRLGEADPRHLKSLRAGAWVEKECDRIRPVVGEVLLNSYTGTSEGAVIGPLRLRTAADRPVGEQALAAEKEAERAFWRTLDKLLGGKGPSRE